MSSDEQTLTNHEKTGLFQISADCVPFINYALQQNGISLIRKLVLRNCSGREYENLFVEIRSDPEIFSPLTLPLGRIAPDETYSFPAESLYVAVHGGYLAGLTEAVRGAIEIRIVQRENGSETVLDSFPVPIRIDTYDQWFGCESVPNILAAFVTPNLDFIGQLQKEAAGILELRTGDGTISGYQRSDRNRHYEVIRAVYEAVAAHEFRYANPPANFGCDGQRVRLPDKIARDGCMTCLDSTLLFASLLEQCGYYPLILLEKNHAYVGCHLAERTLTPSFTDDLQAIRKRVQLDEIVFFETTSATAPNALPFSQAENNARFKLMEADGDYEEKFEGVLDVKGARAEGILPIPLKRDPGGVWIPEPDAVRPPSFMWDQDLRRLKEEISLDNLNVTPQDRIGRWKQSLLDLSLRNKLLNFRPVRAIEIYFPDPAAIEDSLAAGQAFTVLPSGTLLSGDDLRDPELVKTQRNADMRPEFILKEFRQRRLRCKNEPDPAALAKSLLAIYRQAQSDLQEGGMNTLFLTLGMVKWVSPKERREFKAPLLLLPMKLNRKSVKEGFTIERADEDPLVNVTLLEMLRTDFEKKIRGIDPDNLPADESGVDVPKIFQIFRQELRDQEGWELLDQEVWLGIFSFQKSIMWEDLDKHSGDLLQNPIVDHLVNHPTESFHDDVPEVKAEEIDAEYPYSRIMTPLSADSSQLSAVLSAEKGKSFVLHGPPGSGKSQTISNIIAHCLYRGKSVLFVAEKRAALEVVHNRLAKLGLKPFCLELHSNKAGKRLVLDQFAEALDFHAQSLGTDWQQTARLLENEKKDLNAYVQQLHKVYPNGRTLYGAITDLISRQNERARWEKCRYTGAAAMLDKAAADRLVQEIPARLESACRLVPESAWTEFRHVRCQDGGYASVSETLALAGQIAPAAEKAGAALNETAAFFGIGTHAESLAEITAAAESELHLSQIREPVPEGFYTSSWKEDEPSVSQFLEFAGRRAELLARLQKLGFGHLRRNGLPPLSKRINGSFGGIALTLSSRPPAPESGNTPVERLAAEIGTEAGHLAAACRLIARSLGVELPEEIGETTLGHLALMMHELRRAGAGIRALIDTDWKLFSEKAAAAAEVADEHARLSEALNRYDLKLIAGLDADELRRQYEKTKTAFALVRGFKRSRLLRTVRRLQKDWREPAPPYAELPGLFDMFGAYAAAQSVIEDAGPLIRKHAPAAWKSGTVDGALLTRLLDAGRKITGHAEKAFGAQTETVLKNLGANWAALCSGETEAGRAVQAIFAALSSRYDQPIQKLISLIADDAAFDPATLAETALTDTRAPAEPVPLRDLLEALGGYLSIQPLWKEALEKIARLPIPRTESGGADTEKLKRYKAAADEAESALALLAESLTGGNLSPLRERLGAILSRSEGEAPFAELARLGKQLNEASEAFRTPRDAFAAKLDLEPAGPYRDMTPETAAALAGKVIAQSGLFGELCNWNRAAAEAEEAGLAAIVKLIAERKLAPGEIHEACIHAFNTRFVDEVLSAKPALGAFLAGNHDHLREEFRENDAKYGALVQKLIVAELAHRMKTRLAEPGADKELGTLKREIGKKMRHKPVRALLDTMPNLLTALKPCLLMSPISVAQYLPTSREKFDLVIFDEASQIPTCDAIGAIARGNQLIVVGDPKQLPPTSFFQRSRDEEMEEEAEVEELESILDECLTARLSEIHLRWHYRSRHESLIAFSNRHYYENSLFTFPTAKHAGENLGIHFRYVPEGVYDRSKKRTNPAEARALVADAVARMKSPEFRGKSLGIVTFSEAQKGVIDDLLEEERANHTEIDPFFDPEYPEPVFVKNLENVQGDERDVMYFSIGYGPDRNGKVSMNFGPVNRAGGQRRLNVAVTRAKEANFIFSSIRSSDIDLGRISENTQGPHHLKAYLEYAQKGADYLQRDTEGDAPSGQKDLFVQEAAGLLRRAGYHVREKLGLSRYKIDLAVSDPANPDEFLVGIECDGPAYAHAATARDRDILRQSVLQGLHWQILRIWSVQWFKSRKTAEETLLARVAEIFARQNHTPES